MSARVEVRAEDGSVRAVGGVFLDGRRVGSAPLAVMRDGATYAGSPTCDTRADAEALKAAIDAGEAGGWRPHDVFVRDDAPDLYRPWW